MLGELVGRLAEPGVAEAALVEASELGLLARLNEAAVMLGAEVGDVASHIVRTWLAQADDEAWVQLIGVVNRSDAPGLAALVLMLEQALAELDAPAH